ncbi:hypothetical protein [Pontibacillus sp. HMF3514]|uniref:hypothetical protein n=1 Tax=Pontibacillus sp. HMF3514 TaxID=2692425 RepID=UPI00131F6E56|nr:hypothetical protein [Pontibacillus sp. HMF3514]QHE51259.1 hypothetical protein GS400_04080 [Pontibacillus sp. HMF3514]
MRRFIYFALWMVVISITLYFGTKLQFHFKQQTEMTYNPIPQVIFGTLFPVCIGILLKIPGIWDQRKRTKWGVDWAKLIVVGVPCLYFTLGLILVYTSIIPILPLLSYATSFGFPMLHIVAGIVLGYVLLDSIRIPKVEETSKNDSSTSSKFI